MIAGAQGLFQLHRLGEAEHGRTEAVFHIGPQRFFIGPGEPQGERIFFAAWRPPFASHASRPADLPTALLLALAARADGSPAC